MPFRKPKPHGRIKPQDGAAVNWGDPITRGLVGRWLITERYQSRFKDLAGLNNADAFAGCSLSAGAFGGYAMTFDGVAGVVKTRWQGANDPVLIDVPFTISAWACWTDSAKNVEIASMADEASTSAFYALQIGATTGIFYAGTGDGAGSSFAASTAAATVGNWYHVVGVWASTADRRIYVNGRLEGSNTVSRTPNAALIDNTAFGALVRSSTSFGAGKVDNVSIYNRALSANEILRLYNEPFAGIVAPRRRIISSAPVSGARNRFFLLMP